MKQLLALAALAMVFALYSSDAQAQTVAKEHGTGFIDLNNDGYNDNAPDDDKDGVPNGLDADYVKGANAKGTGFVDLNGDGINDNAGPKGNGKGKKAKVGDCTTPGAQAGKGSKMNGQGNAAKGQGNGTKAGNGSGSGSGNGNGNGRK